MFIRRRNYYSSVTKLYCSGSPAVSIFNVSGTSKHPLVIVGLLKKTTSDIHRIDTTIPKIIKVYFISSLN